MLEIIENLPEGVVGVSAHGKVTADDYDKAMIPLLNKAHEKGGKIRFLYNFSPDFEGFTPGAGWQDFKVGLRHLRLFERCAIVTDKDWISKSSEFFGAMLPCPVRCFKVSEYQIALEWLKSHEPKRLRYQFSKEKNLLVLEPASPLDSQDFDAISSEIDPWIEKNGQLNGLVIRAEKFPGWENLGSALRHFQFVKAHHRKIKKVAFCSDKSLLKVMPSIADHFVEAEIKHFEGKDFSLAKEWAQTI